MVPVGAHLGEPWLRCGHRTLNARLLRNLDHLENTPFFSILKEIYAPLGTCLATVPSVHKVISTCVGLRSTPTTVPWSLRPPIGEHCSLRTAFPLNSRSATEH